LDRNIPGKLRDRVLGQRDRRQPFEKWEAAGSEDAAIRANRRWKRALAEYQAPPLDEGIDEALKEFIALKKASMQDAWY
jgi:trimethylamine---corrinoid protein Co-methyltransferase